MSPAINSSAELPSPSTGDWRGDGPARTVAVSTEFISFAIGDEQYGVDIMAVREIKGWSSVTQLPNQPEYMRGVLNLRGVMVPIVDLRCRFGQGLTEATAMHVVIVVHVGIKTVACLPTVCSTSSRWMPPRSSPCPRFHGVCGLTSCPAW